MDEYQINDFPQEPPVIAPPGVSPVQADPGEKAAKLCKVFGVLSIFFLNVPFAILTFIFYGRCLKTGNGENLDKAKTGRTCAIIGILLLILLIVAFFLCRPLIAAWLDDMICSFPKTPIANGWD